MGGVVGSDESSSPDSTCARDHAGKVGTAHAYAGDEGWRGGGKTCSAAMRMHVRAMHAFFFTPGPPKRGLSRQFLHEPQSRARQAWQTPQRSERLGTRGRL